ncbi:MAG: adenine phosphoribosyltransferase [Canibacter sp.]
MTPDRADLQYAESLITLTPNFPTPGILFRDLTPVLADPLALRTVTDALIAPFAGQFDIVAGIEARGFPLAGAIGIRAGVGTMLIRKAGKLPRPAASAQYELEYGTATIEAQADIVEGSRVLVVDDVLATGGTALAACSLIEKLGSKVIGVAVLDEVPDLNGRALFNEIRTHVLF